MKQLLSVAWTGLALLTASLAHAGAISDISVNAYWSSDSQRVGDVIGYSTYDIGGATIKRPGSVSRVTKATGFAGHAGMAPAPAPGGFGYRAASSLTFATGVAASELVNYSSFATHWGETWQSDVIEGVVHVVPVAGSVPLVALGLCALFGLRRSRCTDPAQLAKPAAS